MSRSYSLVFIFFFLCFTITILSSTLVLSSTQINDCMLLSNRCSDTGPEIRFPFWIKGRQPDHCGYPGFAVSCTSTNQTLLQLPFSGSFFVNNINYALQAVCLDDPDGCVIGKLFHLNLSASPFHSFPKGFHQDSNGFFNPETVTFFNCSTTETERVSRYYSQPQHDLVSCLGVPGHQVYAFMSSLTLTEMPLPLCKKIKTISFVSYPSSSNLVWFNALGSFLYYPGIGNPAFCLPLSWSEPSCEDCEAKRESCRLKNGNTSRSETECFTLPKSPSPPALDESDKKIITGATVGSFLLVVAIMISIKQYREYKSDKIEKENQVRILKFLDDYKSLKPSRYTFADIKRITNQFKEKLGEGGYGSVYKGRLSNEILVAVKVFNNSTGDGEDFINEVGTLGRIHHVNVVRLVGFCADGYRRALVYEFLPNESLEKFIFSRDTKRVVLGWEKLQDIAIGIAKGIEYLHQGCDLRILHFDIKPHNILLDDNFNPKVSDFGLAKLFPKDESAVSMTAARGTIGYIAPEVFSRNFGHVSHKSDVYSFGIMLLEMVGGRKNIDSTVQNTSQMYFSQWVYNQLSRGKELEIRIDEDGDIGIARKLTIVALWCIQWYPVDRPSMKVVVQMLEGDRESLIMPPNPFSSTLPSNNNAVDMESPLCTKLSTISE